MRGAGPLPLLLSALLLASCSPRDPAGEVLAHHRQWLQMRSLALLCNRPGKAHSLARSLSQRMDLAVEPCSVPPPETVPSVIWLHRLPGADELGSSQQVVVDSLNAALKSLGRGFHGERDAMWLWAFRGPHADGARFFLLIARRPELVPVDLLRIERSCGAGYQVFADGEPHSAGKLRFEDGHYRPVPVPWAGTAPAVWKSPSGGGAIRGRGFVLHPDGDLPTGILELARLRLNLCAAILPLPSSRPIDIFLHGAHTTLQSADGLTGSERVNALAGRLHWFCGAQHQSLPSAYSFQLLRLRRRFGDRAPSWWIEGLATLTCGDQAGLPLGRIWSFLARWKGCPRGRDLLGALSFESLAAPIRRPLAALLLIQLSALCPDFEVQLELLRGGDLGARAADAALELMLAPWRGLPPDAPPPPPSFVRGVSIEPRFPRGYRDPGYRRALERARLLGANLVVLTHIRAGDVLASLPSRIESNPGDALEEGVAAARRMGFRVRLRLHLDTLRSGYFLGALWQPSARFWESEFETLQRWLEGEIPAAMAMGIDELELGRRFSKALQIGGPPARLWRRALTDLRALWPGRIIFEMNDSSALAGIERPDLLDALAIGNRSAQRSIRAGATEKQLRTLARNFLLSFSDRASRRGARAIELHVRVHAHHLAHIYPDIYLEGADPAWQQLLIRTLLQAAQACPMVRGVVLEGGELDGSSPPPGEGFDRAGLREDIQRCFRHLK